MTPREYLVKAATRARDKALRDEPRRPHRCPEWEPCGACEEPSEDELIATWVPEEMAALAPLLDGQPTPGALLGAGWVDEGADGWWHLKCYWLTLDADMCLDAGG